MKELMTNVAVTVGGAVGIGLVGWLGLSMLGAIMNLIV